MKITESGPEYTKLILLTEDNNVKYNGLPHLDIGVDTLQKLFDYEDVLAEFGICQSPKELKEFLTVADKSMKIVNNLLDLKDQK
mgnify:CR=1 FL=1